jgi:hypothetical protein
MNQRRGSLEGPSNMFITISEIQFDRTSALNPTKTKSDTKNSRDSRNSTLQPLFITTDTKFSKEDAKTTGSSKRESQTSPVKPKKKILKKDSLKKIKITYKNSKWKADAPKTLYIKTIEKSEGTKNQLRRRSSDIVLDKFHIDKTDV